MAITPARDIRIWSDEKGYVQHTAREGSDADLVGQWLTSDIQGDGAHLIELLDAIEALRSAQADKPYEASGNAWHAVIGKDHVDIENKYMDHLTGTVPVETVLRIMRSYWDALRESTIEEGKRNFLKFHRREPRLPW